MRLTVEAPARIDLAGGTLDIYPLYLLMDRGVTLNAAIDLRARVELESRSDGRFWLESRDLGLSLQGDGLDDLSRQGPLRLLVDVLRHYRPMGGLTIRTSSQVPPGSGLGGSSTLLVALSSALVLWSNQATPKQKIVSDGADLEARAIGVPAGRQDYFPAAFGGFSALHFGIGSPRREPLAPSPRFRRILSERLILAYSGASRFSATANWEVVKRFVDGDAATRKALLSIAATSRKMRRSLIEEDIEALARDFAEEWKNRRRLAAEVSSPRLDLLFGAAQDAGAAVKVCGAGGGGCFIALAPEGRREEVEAAITGNDGEILDFRFDPVGVRVVDGISEEFAGD